MFIQSAILVYEAVASSMMQLHKYLSSLTRLIRCCSIAFYRFFDWVLQCYGRQVHPAVVQALGLVEAYRVIVT
jgi:hypothetical protein